MGGVTNLLPGTVLESGRVVPGVALVERRSGSPVKLWDHRQRASLVVSFLHAACDACERFQVALEDEAGPDLATARARAIAVRGDGSAGAARFVGPDGSPLVLVIDRYGAAWRSYPAPGHDFPDPREVAATIWHLSTMCPECGDTAWND